MGERESAGILLILSVLATLGAVLAAVGSWMSAHATRQAAQGHLLSIILREYADPSMAQALRVLRNWKELHGDRFNQAYGERLKASHIEFHRVDTARRQVSHFFQQVLMLHRARCASRRVVDQALRLHGIDVFFQIVEPLEHELNAGYMKENFDELRALSRRTGREHLIRNVPAMPEQEAS